MTSRKEIEEKALLIKFQSGDRRAMDTLFRIYHPALIFFAHRLLVNFDQANAQEIVLDVMLKTFELRETFKSYDSVRAFLYISTKNKCFDVIEKEKVRLNRMNKYSQGLEELDEENILSKMIHTEVLLELSQSIELLPEQCRNIMQSLMDGMTPKEIAEEFHISVSTVNSQKARAISILKKTLSNKGIALLLLCI